MITDRNGGQEISGHDAGHDRSGWGKSLQPGRRPVLLCVDIVNAYFEEGGVLQLPSRDALESAARLLDAARDRGVMVVHTSVRYAPDGSDGGVFFNKVGALNAFADTGVRQADDPGAHCPEVFPSANELVITKQMPSAFFGTSLAGTLTAAGVDTVIVCGVSTSGCIRASVVDAMSYGFIPFVVADACGDRSAEVHDANLADMSAKYAEVIDERMAIAYLSQVADAE